MMVTSLQDHLAVETRVSLAQVIIALRFSSDKRSAATGCRCNKRILLPLPWTRRCSGLQSKTTALAISAIFGSD
ncbi:hypothetical protein PL963_P400066 (plasmid) [Pseudomonas cerasi]|uniref:Uncharacterized protein n=1 Tax=Pseudomonas cerasi TaxID=1583341 RepID=A0A2K4W3I4_9PSED|nr:hypothetical protein PL963_P400066 [Pseudomonas cerasi]